MENTDYTNVKSERKIYNSYPCRLHFDIFLKYHILSISRSYINQLLNFPDCKHDCMRAPVSIPVGQSNSRNWLLICNPAHTQLPLRHLSYSSHLAFFRSTVKARILFNLIPFFLKDFKKRTKGQHIYIYTNNTHSTYLYLLYTYYILV